MGKGKRPNGGTNRNRANGYGKVNASMWSEKMNTVEHLELANAVSAEELAEFVDRVKEFAHKTNCPLNGNDLDKLFKHPTMQLAARMHIVSEDNKPSTFMELLAISIVAKLANAEICGITSSSSKH
jgi:hypothetical protein